RAVASRTVAERGSGRGGWNRSALAYGTPRAWIRPASWDTRSGPAVVCTLIRPPFDLAPRRAVDRSPRTGAPAHAGEAEPRGFRPCGPPHRSSPGSQLTASF